MKKILTNKKNKWAKNRKVVLRGKRLNYNISLQIKYKNELIKLAKKMSDEVKTKIIKLFKGESADDYFEKQKDLAMDSSIASKARILVNRLTRKFNALFELKAKDLAENMINDSNKSSKSNLHTSLKELSGGLSLKTGIVSEGLEEVAKASISENVSLIKSIPQEYFKDVTGSVMRSITTGNGLADLVPDLNKYEGITKRRAKNIAEDQTRKAYNSINKQRLLELGVKEFEWIHSGGGQTPRESHMKMDGMIFSFEKLIQQQEALDIPKSDQGIPGHAINCRCTFTPVIDLSEED